MLNIYQWTILKKIKRIGENILAQIASLITIKPEEKSK